MGKVEMLREALAKANTVMMAIADNEEYAANLARMNKRLFEAHLTAGFNREEAVRIVAVQRISLEIKE